MCDAPLLAEPVFTPGVEAGNAVFGLGDSVELTYERVVEYRALQRFEYS